MLNSDTVLKISFQVNHYTQIKREGGSGSAWFSIFYGKTFTVWTGLKSKVGGGERGEGGGGRRDAAVIRALGTGLQGDGSVRKCYLCPAKTLPAF